MNPHARRLGVLLSPLLLVAACGSSGRQQTVRLLDERLLFELAPNIETGNAALQILPDGARVTLLGPLPITNGRIPSGPSSNGAKRTDDQTFDARASVIEGLLDPSLMRIQLADTSALPQAQRDARVQNVAHYFEAYGLGSTLQPAAEPQTMPPGPAGGAAPSGLTITIHVQCPDRHDGWGYGSGRSMPICD
jgi:hypothetical protein